MYLDWKSLAHGLHDLLEKQSVNYPNHTISFTKSLIQLKFSVFLLHYYNHVLCLLRTVYSLNLKTQPSIVFLILNLLWSHFLVKSPEQSILKIEVSQLQLFENTALNTKQAKNTPSPSGSSLYLSLHMFLFHDEYFKVDCNCTMQICRFTLVLPCWQCFILRSSSLLTLQKIDNLWLLCDPIIQ